MNPDDKTINWQRLIITTLLVVVASAITSSITWFILDRTFNESQQTNAKLIDDLEKKITFLGTKIGDTTPAATTVTGNGTISGKIMYPSSGIPTKIKVFAEDTKTAKVTEATVTFAPTTTDMSVTATYTVSLPVGSYYVYGSQVGFDDQNGSPWKAYYNQYVVCGMAASCKDTTKIVVNVEVNKAVENITIGDWYPVK